MVLVLIVQRGVIGVAAFPIGEGKARCVVVVERIDLILVRLAIRSRHYAVFSVYVAAVEVYITSSASVAFVKYKESTGFKRIARSPIR